MRFCVFIGEAAHRGWKTRRCSMRRKTLINHMWSTLSCLGTKIGFAYGRCTSGRALHSHRLPERSRTQVSTFLLDTVLQIKGLILRVLEESRELETIGAMLCSLPYGLLHSANGWTHRSRTELHENEAYTLNLRWSILVRPSVYFINPPRYPDR